MLTTPIFKVQEVDLYAKISVERKMKIFQIIL